MLLLLVASPLSLGPPTPMPRTLTYIVPSQVALDLGGVHRPPPDQHGTRVEDLDAFQLRAGLGVCKQPATRMRACGIRRPAQNPPAEGRWIWLLSGGLSLQTVCELQGRKDPDQVIKIRVCKCARCKERQGAGPLDGTGDPGPSDSADRYNGEIQRVDDR